MSEFQITKNNITNSRIVPNDLANTELTQGQVLLAIDKFALTANNITYAIMGDKLGYWQFFPPHSELPNDQSADTDGWGVLPVWGFADVVKSNCNEVAVGERLFGYFPPATHVLMQPSKVSQTSWFDSSEHRSALPAGYNIYRRVDSKANTEQKGKHLEDEQMLLFPLHITAFALYDFFQENKWFGTEQLVMLSASSKTSTGLAYGIKHHNDDNNPAPQLVALTSSVNKAMVEGLQAYHETFTYDDLLSIDNSKKTLIVDMSGNSKTLSALHKHLSDNMVFCSNVGVTHWSDFDAGADIIRERSHMFFAPSQIQKRLQEWGPQVFDKKSQAFMARTIGESRAWLKITTIDGLEGMASIFTDVCKGKVAPEAGLVVNMRD